MDKLRRKAALAQLEIIENKVDTILDVEEGNKELVMLRRLYGGQEVAEALIGTEKSKGKLRGSGATGKKTLVLKDGEVIDEFNTLKAATEEYDIPYSVGKLMVKNNYNLKKHVDLKYSE